MTKTHRAEQDPASCPRKHEKGTSCFVVPLPPQEPMLNPTITSQIQNTLHPGNEMGARNSRKSISPSFFQDPILKNDNQPYNTKKIQR
ncbi:MAG: hypothetical protein ACTSUE_08560 [Promethearchaeota archaeon]